MKRREKTELEIAREHYRIWLQAEEEIALNQSYTIGNQSLTRADLGKVAQRLEYWRNRVAMLENMEKGKGRSRIYRVIPREL
ncbi:DUF6148 family protein [Anaerotruncus colihominis]|uniref:DUF6148 family protein n=1 Tax=Anaerotruncus colihominis TaxID=169435 RepID=UPI0035185B63